MRKKFINVNGKVRPLGFDTAATILTMGMSREAAENLTKLVRTVAQEKGYNDSIALRTLRSRLNRMARKKAWAREVLGHLA